MKRTSILSLGLAFLLALATGPAAQEKAAPLAARYEPIARTKQARLVQAYGSPEVQPGFGQTGAYSADGKRAVFASNLPEAPEEAEPSCQLFVWDVAARAFRKQITIADRFVTAVALTADGRTALLGLLKVDAKTHKASSLLALWDLETGKEIRAFGPQTAPIFSLAISPDGTRALAGTENTATQWDLRQGKALAAPKGAAGMPVAFLPNGRQALCGAGADVRLWDLADGKTKQVYKPKNGGVAVVALAVSADGRRFVATDDLYAATVWETHSGKELGGWRHTIAAMLPPASADVVLAEDGRTVVACWGGLERSTGGPPAALVCRFDGLTGKEIWSKTAPMRGAVPLHLAGNDLLLGGGANPFCVWQFADGRETRTWGGHKGPVTALAPGPDGAILSAGNEGVLLLSGGPHAGQVTAWRAHDAAINAMAAGKGGRLLTASADKTVRLHDVAKRTTLATLRGHAGNVTSVAFGPAGAWAASGSDDRTIILWDLKAGKKMQALEGHADAVNCIAVAPAGDWLASAGSDNTVRLWPIKDGALDADRDPVVLEGHTRPVLCVAFSPDGKQLLSAGQDQVVKLWDVAEQKLARELKGHTNWISAAVYYGQDRIVSASDDLTLRLWDARSGEELDRIDLATIQDGPRSLVALGPDQFAAGTSGWLVLRFALPAAR